MSPEQRINRIHAKALIYKGMVERGEVKDPRPLYGGLTKAQKRALR